VTPQAPGRYADGKVAVERDVWVVADTNGLSIVAHDLDQAVIWPIGEVRLVGTPAPDGAFRLCRIGGDARLALSDPALIAHITRNFSRLHESPYGHGIPIWKILMWAGGAVASIVLFFFVLIPAFSDYAVAFVPAALENRAGTWMVDLLITQLASDEGRRRGKTVCAAPAGAAALDRLVSSLGAARKFPQSIDVKVVNGPLVNAFTLPGGHIIVLRGLIDFSNHPNELAGVLAHELGHAEYRHPLRKAIESSSGGFMVALLLGDAVGFSVAASVAGMLLVSHYSRDMETEADLRGLELMHAANFATAPMADFFSRLSAKQPELTGLLSLLSTHPGSPDRASLVSAQRDQGNVALDPAAWAALKKICD
jgi:Zn-dependent protease with chaperone function